MDTKEECTVLAKTDDFGSQMGAILPGQDCGRETVI